MVLLKACLNGGRTRAEHPAVPQTPAELAADARAVVAAGARVLHLHPYDAGVETLAAEPCAAALRAVRAACPGVPISLSTSAEIEPDPARRLAAIAAWTDLPELVSANQGEPGIVELCEHLLARGVGIEAGLLGVADAEAFVRAGLAPRCTRALLEPLAADPVAAVADAAAMEQVLAAAGVTPRAGASRARDRDVARDGAGPRARSWHAGRARGHHGAARRPAGWRESRAGAGGGGDGRSVSAGSNCGIEEVGRIAAASR